MNTTDEQRERKRRGGGGQPGNLNAAKGVLPALKRLRKGVPLPAELQRVAALADREAEELVSDRGGWEALTGGERLMIQNWKSARAAELLIWYEVLSSGAMIVVKNGEKTNWDLQPGLQRLAGFLMAEHRALTALGLERRAKPVQALRDYLTQEYGGDDE